MNKWSFWIIKFILEVVMISVVPMAIAFGVSIQNAGWFSIISFIILDLRDWFIEINKQKNIDENI